jgi:Domain of unknown function (DUF4279)
LERMGIADHSVVALRIYGDDLVPSEVTALLGCEPTVAYSKGDVRIGKKTGSEYVEKTGRWSLSAGDRRPEDIPAQIEEILAKLSQDLAIWSQIKSKYRIDFFCGIFMGSSNVGLELAPTLLEQISKRSISLGLDIYDRSDD